MASSADMAPCLTETKSLPAGPPVSAAELDTDVAAPGTAIFSCAVTSATCRGRQCATACPTRTATVGPWPRLRRADAEADESLMAADARAPTGLPLPEDLEVRGIQKGEKTLRLVTQLPEYGP